jgi:integrase
MKAKLTHSKLEDVQPTDKPQEFRDTTQRGLLLRVQPKPGGTKSWYYEFRVNKKRNRVLLGRFPDITPTDARKMAAKKAGEVENGIDPGEAGRLARKSITLESFIDNHFKPWHEVHRRQTPAMLSRLKSGFRRLLARKVETLTLADFTEHRTWRKTHTIPGARGPATDATLNSDFRAMHAAFNWGVENDLLTANPLKGFKQERTDKGRGFRALTAAEEKAILAKVDQDQPDFFRPMLIVSLDTGIRRNEARTLAWAQVDFECATITILGENAKNHQTRVIPLTPRALKALKDWRALSGDSVAVFPVMRTSAYTRWRKVCAECGIEGVRWHDLRHSFGSRLALAGCPLTVLMRLMGHQNLAVSQMYLHTTTSDAKAAIALLGAGR